MEAYDYKPDGKLHTRYSELVNCIPSKMAQVLKNRVEKPEKNGFMTFGIERHEKMAQYLKEKKRLPDVFGLNLDVDPEKVEHSQDIELFENVIVHFTPDVYGDDWIADLKTTSRDKSAYRNDKQLIFYAWLLGMKKVHYLIEKWDVDRQNLLGYDVLTREITERDIKKIKKWTKDRVELLYKWLKE